MNLRAPHIRLLTIAGLLLVPIAALTWGSIDDIRYKIKGIDGNLWAPLFARGWMVDGRESPGTITFTFDDGPDHRTTPVLLDQLDKYNIKASFFINGVRIHPRTAGGVLNQAVLRDIYRRGHFLGNHTHSHRDITTLDDEGWRTEVFQVEQVIRWLTGTRPWLFRPPFGRTDAPTLARLAQEHYTLVMWNLDPNDWKARNARDLFERTKRLIEENPDGGVLLLHDTNSSTVEMFPLIVEWIEERNARLRARGERTLEIVGLEHFVRSKAKHIR